MTKHNEGATEDAVYETIDEMDKLIKKNIHPPLEYFDALGASCPFLVFYLAVFRLLFRTILHEVEIPQPLAFLSHVMPPLRILSISHT